MSGTYTLDKDGAAVSKSTFDQSFYGLGSEVREDKRKYHMYYQWIPFVLFIQGVLFYVPHWIWEINEDGRIEALTRDLRLPTTNRVQLQAKITDLTQYISETVGSHDGYFLRFMVCDLLNIVNVTANIVFINRYLNYEFVTYGPRCFHYLTGSENGLSPMSVTFPKLTKCRLHYFGNSGTVQNIDSLCVLALNIFNEKIYFFLWFWLVTLFVVTVIVFCFRSVLLFIPRFRAPFFQRRAHTINEADIEKIVSNICTSDFFFLTLLAKNLDITALRLFLSQFSNNIQSQQRYQGSTDKQYGGIQQLSIVNMTDAIDEAGPLISSRSEREMNLRGQSELMRPRQRAHRQLRV